MKQTITPFLQAAQDKGCPIQVGSDMLYEMIPAYLEFFGFGSATPEELRAVSQVPAGGGRLSGGRSRGRRVLPVGGARDGALEQRVHVDQRGSQQHGASQEHDQQGL
jgi:hypothetical protein